MDINELVKIVGAVDPEFRPLMVWLYIDHLSQGEDLRHARGLLESYIGLQRQRHWQPANVSEIDEINTALVTFCQGISTQISETWTEDARTRAGAIDIEKHAIMLGLEQKAENLRPMEPDIVGELVVLDKLCGNNSFDMASASALVSDASRLNPNGLIGFLFRAAGDFPSHEAFRKLLGLDIHPVLRGQIIHYLILGLNKPGPDKDRGLVLERLDTLRALTENHPSQELGQVFLSAYANSCHGFADESDLEQVIQMFDFAMETFRNGNSRQAAIAFAGAVGNLMRTSVVASPNFEWKFSAITRWMDLTDGRANVVEATNSIISAVGSEFSNAVKDDGAMEGAPSLAWLAVLDSICAKQPQDEYSRSSPAGVLIEAYKKGSANNYEFGSRLMKLLLERVSLARSDQLTDFSTNLFGEAQRLKNSGVGHPRVEEFLSSLAKHNPHARLLMDHT